MGGSVPAIPGQKADHDLALMLRHELAQLLGRDKINFPGAQPVSFAARHLIELQKQDYFLCEKSDGIRCLMYLTNDGPNEVTYLIDRKNDYYWVQNLHFPLADDEQLFHQATLVDGELVNDRQPNGMIQLKYLVFDCMVLNEQSLMQRTLDKRLAYFQDKIFSPYQVLYKKYPSEIQYLPFIVELKKMEVAYGIEMMFKDVLPHLPHGNDGLIFTCRTTPYKFGTDEHILKWKEANENSVDFRLSFEWPMAEPDSEDERDGNTSPYPDYDAMPKFNLGVFVEKNQYLHHGTMFVTPEQWEGMKSLGEPLDDKIVECFQDEYYRWRFLRFRDDKTEANHISTVESVIESIRDRISQNDLIRNAKKIRDEWKKRLAVDDAQMKQEVAARKVVIASPGSLPVTNGHDGPSRDLTPATKRKYDNSDSSMDEDESNKKKLTPQRERSSELLG